MKRHIHRTLATIALAAVLSLGLVGASWAAEQESSRDRMPNFPQIIEQMMEQAHLTGNRHHRGRHGMHGPRPYSARPLISIALRNQEELKLTDDQVKRLKDIRDAFSKLSVKQRAEMKTRRIDIRRALDNEKVDLADVEKKIREISTMRADLRIARLKAIQEGKSLLNAEQQKQLSEFVRKHRGRGHHRFHHQMYRGSGSGDNPKTY